MSRQTRMVRSYRFFLLLCALSALAQDGARVDLGTHKLNIVCTGSPDARPVVILEAGGGGASAAWSAVQAALPVAICACAYDRAGSGKSDPGPSPVPWTPKLPIFMRSCKGRALLSRSCL